MDYNIEEIQLSKAIFSIFRDICILEKNKFHTQAELAKFVGRNATDVNFNKSLKILSELRIIEIRNGFYNTKKVIINLKELDNFIRSNCNEFKSWEKYIHATRWGAVTK